LSIAPPTHRQFRSYFDDAQDSEDENANDDDQHLEFDEFVDVAGDYLDYAIGELRKQGPNGSGSESSGSGSGSGSE